MYMYVHTLTHTFNIPFPAPWAEEAHPLRLVDVALVDVEAAQTWSMVQGGNSTSSSAANWFRV
jgi:hypothetical protein